MVFRDKRLVCENCGRVFFFTVTEQRRQGEQVGEENIVPPKLCLECRGRLEPASPPSPVRIAEPILEERWDRPKQTIAAIVDEFPLEEEGVELKLIGEVKWFSREKGYGFVVMADGEELFFHRSSIEGRQLAQIEEGLTVEFQVRQTEKGPEAVNVSILPPP